MNLILAFSNIKEKDYSNKDIIIYGHKLEIPKSYTTIDINQSEPNTKEITKYYDLFAKQVCNQNSSQLNNRVCKGSNNNLYTNHLYIFKWAKSIDEALKKSSFKKIIITDYINNKNYIPYYEAEGEAHKHLCYKPYDFIPLLLKNYILNKHQLKPIIIKKRSHLLLLFRIFTRRYILFFFKVLFYTFQLTKFKLRKKEKSEIPAKVSKLIVTRSVAHYDAIHLINKTDPNTLIFCGESLFTFGNNYKHTLLQTKRCITFLNSLTIKTIVKTSFEVINQIKSRPRKTQLSYDNISYNYTNAFIEMAISYFDVLLLEKTIKQVLKTHKPQLLITCEMYTPFTISLAYIGSSNNIKTAQLQATNMFIIEEPQYIFCDYFFFQNKLNQTAFKKNTPRLKEKAKYIGNFMINSPKPFTLPTQTHSSKNTNIKNIIYFTQPLTDEEIEQEIITELVRLSKIIQFKVHIKLHPRDNIKKIKIFKNDINIIDNNSLFENYIQKMDIAFLKTSSIALKIILNGTPIIYCLFSKWAKNSKLDYINQEYKGSIYNLKDIESSFNNIEPIYKSYKSYQENYIKENQFEENIKTFNKNLIKLNNE